MGKKSKGGKKKGKKLDADLDKDVDRYEPSDSDDGFRTEDKILLERAKHGKLIQDDDSEEEVFRIHSSSDEDEEEHNDDDDEEEKEQKDKDYYGGGVGSDFDSDIEGTGDGSNLPNDKAWGKKKHRYYNTDYVDQDYGGFGKDEEEKALMEEKEADAIQRRLMSHLEGTDFTLGLLDRAEQKKAEIAEKEEEELLEGEKIQTDLSKLSDEEKVQFLKQESPELFPLIDDFKDRLNFVKTKITPILKLVEEGEIPDCLAAGCLKLQREVIMKYCMNIGFYLFLKGQRIKVDNHPILKKIYTFRKLLEELDSANKEILIEQIEKILAVKKKNGSFTVIGNEPQPEPKNRAERRKRKLNLLEEKKKLDEKIEEKKRKLELERDEFTKENVKDKLMKEVRFLEPSDDSDGSDAEADEAVGVAKVDRDDDDNETEDKKRAINFKIAKNKGLTPRRKKEQRNPRVKHRNKFKKAKIRRKGQVREVRKELDRYGGEVSGIKAYVSKSIKLK